MPESLPGLNIFGSQQVRSQSPVGMLGAEEARKAAEKAPEVAEEAFRQVGGLQAIGPRVEPLLQEHDRGLEVSDQQSRISTGQSIEAAEVLVVVRGDQRADPDWTERQHRPMR